MLPPKATIIFTVFVLALFGCDSETGSTDTSIVRGDIIGSVILTDTLVKTVLDPAGVTVSIEGTNFTAISDSNGYWHLKGIPAGTYVLVYKKPGFGTKKIFNMEYVGNGTLYFDTQRLLQLPTVGVDVVLRGFSPEGKADYSVNISSDVTSYVPYKLKALLFLSKRAQIDPLNNDFDLSFISSWSPTGPNGYSVIIQRYALLNSGYKSGDKVFVLGAVNLVEEMNDYGYYDYSLRKFIYTGLGQNFSPVYSFILP